MLQTIFSAPQKSQIWSQTLGAALVLHFSQADEPPTRIAAGQTVFHAGQQIHKLPWLASGQLDCVMSLRGGEAAGVIPVSFGPGEVALLSQVFCNTPVWIDLVAAQDCEVHWLSLRRIEDLLQRDASLLLMLTQFLAQRLREVQTRELGWMERSVRNRVGTVLMRLTQKAPVNAEGIKILAVTHEALAARCGVSRPKLSQELKRLEKAHCIRLQRGQIEVLSLDNLLDH